MRIKISLLVALVVCSLSMQAQVPKAWPDACGKYNVQFKIKTHKAAGVTAPESGKAQIVFIEALEGTFFPSPSSRFAVDGNWVGADHGASYFAVSVEPGEHHLCAGRQSSVSSDKEDVGVATVNAEAGKTYYYELKIRRIVVGSIGRADGGGGGVGVGTTPDMTARQGATVDSVVFTLLPQGDAADRLKASLMSTFSVKP